MQMCLTKLREDRKVWEKEWTKNHSYEEGYSRQRDGRDFIMQIASLLLIRKFQNDRLKVTFIE